MSRYRFWLDPICLGAIAGYGINRWLVPPALKGVFLQGYFDDVLFLPAALPPMLWLHQCLGLRTEGRPPAWSELALHWVVWSVAAEVVAPRFFPHAVGDPWDVVAYAAGGLLAGWLWQRP